jgi:hypothetical protein
MPCIHQYILSFDPVFGFTTTCAIMLQCLSLLTLWVRNPVRRGVLDTTLCDKICQWLATGRWFSPGTPVSSTNKTDRHDITEILLKVAQSIIALTLMSLAHNWGLEVVFWARYVSVSKTIYTLFKP